MDMNQDFSEAKDLRMEEQDSITIKEEAIIVEESQVETTFVNVGLLEGEERDESFKGSVDRVVKGEEDSHHINEVNLHSHELTHMEDEPLRCDESNEDVECERDYNGEDPLECGEREKPLKCSHCNMTFFHNSFLENHERIHTGKRRFQCRHCDKEFVYRSLLTIHEKIHYHTEEKAFKCKHCDKGFTYRRSLTEHERIHTEEKPFKCEHCDKGFTRRGHLAEHERIHTGEKPLKCKHCDNRFSNGSCLKRHMNRCHKDI